MVVSFKSVVAQSPYVLPGTNTDHIIQRLEILHGTNNMSAIRNRSRAEIADISLSLIQMNDGKRSLLDRSDLEYILSDNNDYIKSDQIQIKNTDINNIYQDSTNTFYSYSREEKQINRSYNYAKSRNPVLTYFYKSEANFLELNSSDLKLRINPIVNINYGQASNNDNTVFQNTRGGEVRGIIDNKVYFYTRILENQRGFNDYLERRIQKIRAIPGNGNYKSYESSVIESLVGYDYLNAQAYVGVNLSKSVSVEFGHGKHFIGNGIRSLLLSDTGHNYFYLKFNTKVWKFQYQNIFAELSALSNISLPGDQLLPKKYFASHYLGFKPTDNLEFGIFETVVFGRENHFEFQYLNPIILYRSIEQFLGSPDNVLIGLNGSWNFLKRYSVYGQIMLDEFKLKEFTDGSGWWGNKYGIQLGLKYINVLDIDHLDAQIEYNIVRPYTYSHRDTLPGLGQVSLASYSHYAQPLAHPLGANFKEILAKVRYQPTKDIFLETRAVITRFGDDDATSNWGGNILIPSDSRENDFGNSIGQGQKTNILLLGMDVSYQVFHNYFFDLKVLYRKADADLEDLNFDTKYVGAGIRINLGNYNLDY